RQPHAVRHPHRPGLPGRLTADLPRACSRTTALLRDTRVFPSSPLGNPRVPRPLPCCTILERAWGVCGSCTGSAPSRALDRGRRAKGLGNPPGVHPKPAPPTAQLPVIMPTTNAPRATQPRYEPGRPSHATRPVDHGPGLFLSTIKVPREVTYPRSGG